MTFDETHVCLGVTMYQKKKKCLDTIYSDVKETVLEDFSEEASKTSRDIIWIYQYIEFKVVCRTGVMDRAVRKPL